MPSRANSSFIQPSAQATPDAAGAGHRVTRMQSGSSFAGAARHPDIRSISRFGPNAALETGD